MDPFPAEVSGAGWSLRLWDPGDASALHAALCVEEARLTPWIPSRVATATSVPDTEARLRTYGDDVRDGRAWRYGLWAEDATLLGEFDVFPRDAARRVRAASADRVEFGYWLRAAATGRGLVTSAAQSLLPFARAWPMCRGVEIRCDPANAASAGVPVRLGFVRDAASANAGDLDVWRLTW